MEILDVPDFTSKFKILETLSSLRGNIDRNLDQSYVTLDTIIRRLQSLGKLIDDQRVLAIGDSDLTALSIAIFGSPQEVVVTDIDRRLTDILFEANMEYDLPVRFVYHDMRIKIIEILLHQYTLIIMEPPRSKAGITVFLSRAMQCIQKGFENQVFISIPNTGKIQDFFLDFCNENQIEVLEKYHNINEYENGYERSDFLRLSLPKDRSYPVKSHWIEPFYTYEEIEPIKEYRCLCEEMIKVGSGMEYSSIDELRNRGHSCGHKDIFAYHSKVKLV